MDADAFSYNLLGTSHHMGHTNLDRTGLSQIVSLRFFSFLFSDARDR